MKQVSKKTAKKIGLVGSISLMIGSIIGIGIFFKNGGVFNNNGHNGIGVLISWILAAIIAFCTAFSFAEIGFGKRKGAGLAGSAELMYGYKLGRFINFNQSFFYFGILNVCIAIFTAESVFNLFKLPENFHIGYVFLLSIAFIAIFLLFNYLSVKWSTRFQVLATALKFVPLITVAITGIVFGIQNPESSLLNPNNLSQNKAGLSFQNIIISLPSILFAFDSFLCFGTIKSEMKDENKQVPLTVVIGMIIVIIFYLFVTIGQTLAGVGSAPGLFAVVFKDNPVARQALTITLNVFILVSIVGVLNSLVLTGLRNFQQAITSRLFFGYWLFKKIYDKKPDSLASGVIISSIVYGFWIIVLMIPSVILNTDKLIDGISNFPTLFMFAIYGTIVLKGLINRLKGIQPERKMLGFIFFAIISVLGCYLAFGYLFFYEYSFSLINEANKQLNWGLFMSGNFIIYKWQGTILFIVCVMVFCLLPLINDLALKKYYVNKAKKLNNFEKMRDNILGQLILESENNPDLIQNIEQIKEAKIFELLTYLQENNKQLLTLNSRADAPYYLQELIV